MAFLCDELTEIDEQNSESTLTGLLVFNLYEKLIMFLVCDGCTRTVINTLKEDETTSSMLMDSNFVEVLKAMIDNNLENEIYDSEIKDGFYSLLSIYLYDYDGDREVYNEYVRKLNISGKSNVEKFYKEEALCRFCYKPEVNEKMIDIMDLNYETIRKSMMFDLDLILYLLQDSNNFNTDIYDDIPKEFLLASLYSIKEDIPQIIDSKFCTEFYNKVLSGYKYRMGQIFTTIGAKILKRQINKKREY